MENNSNPVPSSIASGIFKTLEGKNFEIRDVWAANLEKEMEIIREYSNTYPFIAMVHIRNVFIVWCL